jgi:iron-sulfur cluster repair protein YtfE (RIC family)
MNLGQLKHKLQILQSLKSEHAKDTHVLERVTDLISEVQNEINEKEMLRVEQIVFNALREKGLA